MSFSADKDGTPIFNSYCESEMIQRGGAQQARLEKGAPELRQAGITATEVEQPKSRRPVDKDRVERATRESKALIDRERAARDEKTARLRQMRLARACQ